MALRLWRPFPGVVVTLLLAAPAAAQTPCPTPAPPPAPPAPRGVRAVAGNGSVMVQWWSLPHVRYEVGRSLVSGGPYTSLAFVPGRVADSTVYTDVRVQNGTTYYYVVRRWLDRPVGTPPPCPGLPVSVPSPWSEEVSAIPDATLPTPTPLPTVTPTPRIVEITPPGRQVVASTDDGNVPANTVDNRRSTRWSAYGDAWIRFDLGGSRTISYVRIAVYRGHERRNRFDLEVSDDDIQWRPLLAGAESSGTTAAEETYDVPDTRARYLRYVGHGSTVGRWNSLTEVSVFGR